jgi:PKD repeat protein
MNSFYAIARGITMRRAIHVFLPFMAILLWAVTVNAQKNIAPQATITGNGTGAAGCQTGACSVLNDLNLGTCGTQQMWISTSTPPSTTIGADYIQWDFPSPKRFNKLIIHHASNLDPRFLAGALIQYWNGSSWVSHYTFSNLPLNCSNTVVFNPIVASRFRITQFVMKGPGQLSNPNFREFEIIEAPGGYNDAGITGLISPVNFCAGTKDIKVVLQNMGRNAITGVKVNWSFDGVAQTGVNYTSKLDTFGGTGKNFDTVTLGSKTFSAGVPYKLKVWPVDPNSKTDTVRDNDTLSLTIMASLSGTFTIGGTSPNYTTVAAAVSDLNKYGVCGPVTFDIRAGTYTGQVVLSAISGASATNTITFKGAGRSSTTITNAGTSTADMATVLLNGADYVTFKDMTIAATGATYGFAVQLYGGADYNTIDNCNISASTTSTSATTAGIVMSGSLTSATTTGATNNFNTIKNNAITGGYYAITMMGTNTTAYSKNNQILNNTITNYYYYGSYIYYGSETKVIGNAINTTRNTTAYGMLFYYQSNFQVQRNNINVPYYGIYCYYANYYLYNSAGTQSTIDNNFFNSTGYYGAYIYYPSYLNLHYNTIRGNSTYCVYIYTPYEVSIKGNIFWNTSANYVFYSSLGSFNYIDYNIYYGSATTPIYYNAAYASLAAWQSAVPQFNKNSLQQDPKLNSSSDLHISQTVTVPWGPDDIYTLDVDGDSRCRFAPTIGADESALGKTLKPTAGMNAPDTVFINSPTDFYGNQTPGIPHGNRWYVNNVLLKDSVDFTFTPASTGTYTIKVVAYGCQKSDSATKTVIVVNPTSAPTSGFIADKNLTKPGEIVTLTELSGNGATSFKWEITPATTYDASGNPIDRYTYSYGTSTNRVIKVRFDVAGAYKVCLTATNSQGSTMACKEAYIRVQPAFNMGVSTTFVNDSAGYLFDNGGPNGLYGNSLGTSALIAPCASEVYLIFKSFELECAWDYVRLYDGADKTGKVLHPCTTNPGSANGPGLTGLSSATCTSICRPALTDTFKAKSGKMYIEMATDGTGQYNGFEAYWWSKPKHVDPPQAEFDFPSTVCVDIPVSFTNKTTGESVTYQWDLDDDMSQLETNSKNAGFVYFTPGKYVITLIAYNCGGVDTVRHEITVISPNSPGVAFTADNINPTTNDIVLFSPDIKECVSEYLWRFKPASGTGKALFVGGTKNTSMNPKVMFTDTGCYSAFLYAKNSGGEDSLELTCYIKVKSPYCIPTVSTNVPDLGISEVTLTTVSSQVILSSKSTQGIDDYQNFIPTISATLESGVSYDLKVSRSTNLNEVTRTMWIDWDLDGDFNDVGEKVAEQRKSNSASWTTRFTVPTNTKFGATVMRVASNQGSLNNAVCGPNKYGEYEDYRIYLTPDLTPPVIELIGKDTVYVEQGYSYTEGGATAKDNLDGDITAKIKKTNVPTFNNMIPGTYLIHFDVQDVAGNQAVRVTRVVIVTPDATAPDLVVTMDDTIYVDVFDPDFTYPEAVLAEDLVDGDLLSEVGRAGAVDINTVGTYTVIYSVSDASGNTSTVTRVIIVRDRVAPVITRTGADTVYHEVNTPYVDAGASAADNYCDNSAMTAAILTTGNVNAKKIGVYTIVYTLTDCNGNPAVPVMRTVIVQDTKAPGVTLNGDDSLVLEVFDKTFTDKGITASDNYGTPTVMVTGTFYNDFKNGVPTKLGDYTIIYTVTDSAGNMTVVTRYIKVVDTEAPVITMIGQPTANVCRWAEYKDASYDLSDNYWPDSNITVTTEGDFVNTLMEGMFSFRYIATDKSGNVGKSSWRIVRVMECASGLAETGELENAVAVYPNPNSGRFTVSFELESSGQVSVKVINALGQEVKTIDGGNMSAGTLSIDLGNQASGVYMLHIIAGNKTAVKRVVVNR